MGDIHETKVPDTGTTELDGEASPELHATHMFSVLFSGAHKKICRSPSHDAQFPLSEVPTPETMPISVLSRAVVKQWRSKE